MTPLHHIPCLGGGMAHAPGMTPTDSWDLPCVQRGPGKPGGCQPWCKHRQLSLGKQSWWEREGKDVRGQAGHHWVCAGSWGGGLTWRWRRWRRSEGCACLLSATGKHPLQAGKASAPPVLPTATLVGSHPHLLTELIKVGVCPIRSWHSTDQPSLQECRPLVHQAALPTHVILPGKGGHWCQQQQVASLAPSPPA